MAGIDRKTATGFEVTAKIGLVCPAYGYPGFLPELATSILGQKTSVPFRAVFVDDCCPDPETAELCSEYACGYPEIFHYIRPRENRGLSAVRNAGVDYLLGEFPQLEGLTFLDADDRIFPLFVERSYRALREAVARHEDKQTRVGWVFEDPYMIGISGVMRRLRKHSILWNLVGATQTSSSIMSAEMFRLGLRYAEDMKHGGEDWEFSLRAYKAGYRAYFRPMAGLRYRRRPGSMSASAAASLGMERNRADIRLRHPDLYRIGFVTERYAEECRHYCLIDEEGDVHLHSSAGGIGEKTTLDALLRRLSDNCAIPGIPVPQHFIFAHSSFLALLKSCKRLFDFHARINSFEGNWTILNHLSLPPAAPARGAAATFGFARQMSGSPAGGAPVGAVSMTREMFLRLVNDKEPGKNPPESEFLNWRLPGAERLPPLSADEILGETIERARALWPQGIRPAHRIKEQAWQPAGLTWRDLPAMLTGLKAALPEPANRRSALLLTRGEDLSNPACLEELLEFAKVFRNAPQAQRLALAAIDTARISRETADLFDDLYLIPKRLPAHDPQRWNDEKLLLSITASFGCVVSIGTTRLNDHTAILRKNGVRLFHKLYQGSGDFEHGRALISMFKAYNGFISSDEREALWLQSHGAPAETILPFRKFQAVIASA